MNEFTKKDLKTGHIVKFRNGETAILIGDTFFSSMHLDGGFNDGHLDQYSEYLKDIEYGYETDIMEVYYIKSIEHDLGLTDLINDLPEEHIELIWKRKLEIDWTKVPSFTRVLAKNVQGYWENRYFVRKAPHKYVCTRSGGFTFVYNSDDEEYFTEIKIFDKNDIKEEWYK